MFESKLLVEHIGHIDPRLCRNFELQDSITEVAYNFKFEHSDDGEDGHDHGDHDDEDEDHDHEDEDDHDHDHKEGD